MPTNTTHMEAAPSALLKVSTTSGLARPDRVPDHGPRPRLPAVQQPDEHQQREARDAGQVEYRLAPRALQRAPQKRTGGGQQ